MAPATRTTSMRTRAGTVIGAITLKFGTERMIRFDRRIRKRQSIRKVEESEEIEESVDENQLECAWSGCDAIGPHECRMNQLRLNF